MINDTIEVNTKESSDTEASDQKKIAYDNDSRVLRTGTPKQMGKVLKKRISFVDVLKNDGHHPFRSGSDWMCLCPFHAENNPSFSIYENETKGKCHGCDWSGDIIAYVMERDKVDFTTAVERLKSGSYQVSGAVLKASKSEDEAEEKLPYVPTAGAIAEMEGAAAFLAANDSICEEIATARGWKTQTIKQLAEEGVLGCIEQEVAFIYATGMKLRPWPERGFTWRGKTSIWRSDKISAATDVYITEGETDAITMIDRGVENTPGHAVVSLPSANIRPPNLPDLVRGKRVRVFMDNDEAGVKGKDKLVKMLLPVCSDLYVFEHSENESATKEGDAPCTDMWDLSSQFGSDQAGADKFLKAIADRSQLVISEPEAEKKETMLSEEAETVVEVEPQQVKTEAVIEVQVPNLKTEAVAETQPSPVKSEPIAKNPTMAGITLDLGALVRSAKDLFKSPPALPEELICGLLHRGGTMMLGGGSKTNKTFCLIDMALSVASGTEWWNMKTKMGRVLYLDFELPDGFFFERIKNIAQKKNMPEEWRENLDVLNLRGKASDFDALSGPIIQYCEGKEYSLIIIDPIYKVLGKRDENSAGDINSLMSEIDKVAVNTGAALTLGHHFSKGSQAGKESMDRMSGSGVWGRSPDAIMVLTKHEQEGAYAVDTTLRNFKGIDPFCVQWKYPLMERDPALDPTKLKRPGNKNTIDPQLALAALGDMELTSTEWKNASKMKDRTFYDKRGILLNEGKVVQSSTGKYKAVKPAGGK